MLPHRRLRLRADDREILRLAVPAFLALVAEPLFLLADAAIVGHLGTSSLAALGVAGAVLQTAVGLCVFLAYGTTASVARRIGAGDDAGALTTGWGGVVLAALLGVLITVVGELVADPVAHALSSTDHVATLATGYLRIALLGVTPLLVMLATTGILRGLQDTRTPLVVAVVANLVNVVLNVLLVYPLGLGLPGSAIGSVIAQALGALALVAVVLRAARRAGVSLRPRRAEISAAGRTGVPLVVRTLTLRVSLLVTTYAAARLGTVELAAQQLALTVWGFLAFCLDAVAIAAQAMTGRSLGAGDLVTTRAMTDRMTWWGVATGLATGVLLAGVAPWVGALFTSDPAVRDALAPVLLVAAIFQPMAGVVFVLDGVLIGAGDGRYLAWGGAVVLLVFAPLALLTTSLVGLWLVFGLAFMGGRLLVLLARARGTHWMVTGPG